MQTTVKAHQLRKDDLLYYPNSWPVWVDRADVLLYDVYVVASYDDGEDAAMVFKPGDDVTIDREEEPEPWEPDDSTDDHDALVSAGWGNDEDYYPYPDDLCHSIDDWYEQ